MTKTSYKFLFKLIVMIIAAIVMMYALLFKTIYRILKFFYDICIEYKIFENIFSSIKEHKKISLCVFLTISIVIGVYSAYITIEKERIAQEQYNAEMARLEQERSKTIRIYEASLDSIKKQKSDEASDNLKKLLDASSDDERIKNVKYLYYYVVAIQNNKLNPTQSYNYLKLIPEDYNGECADVIIPFRNNYLKKIKSGEIKIRDVFSQMQELLNPLNAHIKEQEGPFSDFRGFKLVDENKLIVYVTPTWGFYYDWAQKMQANKVGDYYEKLLNQKAVPVNFKEFKIEFRDELDNQLETI